MATSKGTRKAKKSGAATGAATSENVVTAEGAAKKGTGAPAVVAATPVGTEKGAPVAGPAAPVTSPGAPGSSSGGSSSSTAPLPSMTSAEIANCLTLAAAIAAAIPALPALSKGAKARTAKLRKGGEAIVPVILLLASQYGVQGAELPLDTVTSQLNTATALSGLSSQLTTVQKAIDDYVFSLQSSSWSTASAAYGVLKRLALRNPAIATGLAPVVQFFAYRTPAVKAKHPKTAKGKAALAASQAAPTAQSAPATPQSTSAGATTGHA